MKLWRIGIVACCRIRFLTCGAQGVGMRFKIVLLEIFLVGLGEIIYQEVFGFLPEVDTAIARENIV